MNDPQILKLARDTGQENLRWVLATLLDAGSLSRFERAVEALAREKRDAPELTVPEVEIAACDDLTPTTSEEVGD